MRVLALAVALLGVAFAVVGLWPHEAAASSPGGVSLAKDWTLDLVEAQPTSNYWNRAQSDARYCKLTGCTGTGTFTTTKFRTTAAGANNDVVIGPSGDDNTGIWFPAADTINLTTGGVLRLQVTGTGQTVVTGGLLSSTEAVATTYLRSTGVATGSLPSCAAGIAGALEYDTTVKRLAACDDSSGSYAWRYLAAGGSAYTLETHAVNLFGGNSGSSGAASEDLNFLGPGYQRDSSATWTKVTVDMVACNWATAGSGGTTGVVVQVYDATDSAEICSCTLGACNTSARQPLSCACGGALVEEDAVLTLRLKSTTDCATNPTEVTCNVMATIAP